MDDDGGFFVFMMLEEEEERRKQRQREEEERRRKRRLEEEEEERRIKECKYSPVSYNGLRWQIDRCVKAFSMQPFVQKLITTIEEVRPSVIKKLEDQYDKVLLDTGYEYEVLKNDLDKDIETLDDSKITIKGEQYVLTRLPDTKAATIEKTTEYFGNVFTIGNGLSIVLNPEILSNNKYYEKNYEEMNHVGIIDELLDINAKIEKYKKYGKYLGFLLKTRKYSHLKARLEILKKDEIRAEEKRQELKSFNSLSKDQLLVINSYFTNLNKLIEVSNKINKLFDEKDQLRVENNSYIYDLTIKEIMSNDKYVELVSEVSDYISNMCSSDEKTMEEAYQLVQGEYPIRIERRFLYDLMIENMKDNPKKTQKQLKKSNNKD